MAREVTKVDQDLIPVFDGDKTTLRSYINACEFLIEEYLPQYDPANAQPNQVRMAKRLLMIFMGRLRAKAREAVDANKMPTTWPELKNILIHSFGDKRSEDVLVYDLNSLCPRRDDTTASYANKIKTTLYTLLSKINLEEDDAQLRQIKLTQFNQIALRTYLFGLDLINSNIGMEVKLRSPPDIETAEAYALEAINYNTQKNRFINNYRQHTPLQNRPVHQQQKLAITPGPHQQQQRFNPHQQQQQRFNPQQQQQQRHNPQQQRQYQHQQYQRSPQKINQYIPPGQPNRQPSYSQQYRNNQTFAKTPAQIYQRPYQPTPMDIDTSAQKRAGSSLVKPPAKRQWISNNIEIPEEEQDDEIIIEEYQDGTEYYENTESEEYTENDDEQNFYLDQPDDQLT